MTQAAERWQTRALRRPAGVARFIEIYRDAGLLPLTPAESRLLADLERCLGCGNCLAVCPVLGALAPTPYPGPRAVGTGLSRCLPEYRAASELVGYCTTCMACEEVCPADVPVFRAVLMVRAKCFEQLAVEGREPLPRLKLLLVDFFSQGRLGQLARWGSALQKLAYRRTSTGEMQARLPLALGALGSRLLPPLAARPLTAEFPGAVSGLDPDGPRVAVFAGCLDNYAYTDTGRALVEVLRRHSREVVVPAGQVCCGAPAYYAGDLPTAWRLAVENARVFAETGADFVVTACASCGDVLTREYPVLARSLPESQNLPERGGTTEGSGDISRTVPDLVASLAARARDVHAFLGGEVSFRPPRARPEPGGPLRVTLHDPCHLARGQGLAGEVRRLVTGLPGVEVEEMRDPGACCGGAGSYALDHHDVAVAIRRPKIEAIAATGAGVVVTGCPSCRLHIADGLAAAGLARPVRHFVELAQAAYAAERA
ncbi:MAG: (Fe-S)-binding protein [Firmicutes bacterium]|nr:(Fe-S)-binding protein [Bacillota bacterium]